MGYKVNCYTRRLNSVLNAHAASIFRRVAVGYFPLTTGTWAGSCVLLSSVRVSSVFTLRPEHAQNERSQRASGSEVYMTDRTLYKRFKLPPLIRSEFRSVWVHLNGLKCLHEVFSIGLNSKPILIRLKLSM